MAFSLTKKWVFWLLLAALAFLFLHAIKAILLPFVVGILVAYFLDPAADRLERMGLSRTASTTIITLLFFVMIAVALATLVPMLAQQLSHFLSIMPHYISEMRHVAESQLERLLGTLQPDQVASAREAVGNASSDLLQSAIKMITGVFKSGFAIINLISLLVITPVVSFYLLRDWDKITHRLDRLLPRAHAETIRTQIAKMDDAMAGFMRGTVNVMVILGSFYALALSLAGLPFAVLIGLLSGMLIIIPYLGTLLSGITAISLAYLQHEGMGLVAAVATIFIVGQMLEGYVLTPRMVGKRVGLHPLWLIFGMLAGASLFGFVGIFLAVPVTAMIGVLVRFATEQYLASSYYDTTSGIE